MPTQVPTEKPSLEQRIEAEKLAESMINAETRQELEKWLPPLRDDVGLGAWITRVSESENGGEFVDSVEVTMCLPFNPEDRILRPGPGMPFRRAIGKLVDRIIQIRNEEEKTPLEFLANNKPDPSRLRAPHESADATPSESEKQDNP